MIPTISGAPLSTRGGYRFQSGTPGPRRVQHYSWDIPGQRRWNLTTIAENQRRFDFIGVNPSINDSGQVSFAATLDAQDKLTGDNIQAILRGDGKKLTTIATTADQFDSFGFDTSINDSGEVAFAAELDEEFGFDEELFSGSGGKKGGVTRHYLTSTDVSLDGQPVRFAGSDSRPSINDSGNIAFVESIQPDFARGIFVGQEGEFTTIVAPDSSDPSVGYGAPILNDAESVAFLRSFFDETAQRSAEEIVKIEADGKRTVVADTRGEFASFGFRPPSLNNNGDVAFLADLDSAGSGIFVGADPLNDRVISTGDALDGSTVQYITFCEQGLSDSGELAFVAQLEADTPDGFRTAVFRATAVP